MTCRARIGTALTLGFASVALVACGTAAPVETPEPTTIAGDCQTVFGGEVCTWGTMTDGVVTEFGATVEMAAIEGAPMEGEMVFPPVPEASIPLPASVATAVGFNHLGVNWELHGHPPALFMTPHFDFHFYADTPAGVAAIDCADLQKPVALPAAYTLPDIEVPEMGTLVGLCVPGMGMHAIPTAELELTEPFETSMIVGYYQAALTFIEPMVSREKLLQAADFSIAVPAAPAGTPAAMRWPTAFSATYDAAAQAYRFAFTVSPQ